MAEDALSWQPRPWSWVVLEVGSETITKRATHPAGGRQKHLCPWCRGSGVSV